jgi:hypothetical protein
VTGHFCRDTIARSALARRHDRVHYPGRATEPDPAEWRQPSHSPRRRRNDMPKFVIEREIPGAGKLSPAELQGISQKSCGVLRELGPRVQWLHSYVTDDKIYCVYIAPDEAAVRKHAEMGGFPANSVSAVRAVIDPTTAE